MEAAWIALIAFLGLVGLGVVAAAATLVFLRFRSGTSVHVSMRLLLRLYLYVVIVVGLILFTQGASHLIRAGFASAWGNEFSYEPRHVATPEENDEIRKQHPLELKSRDQLTDGELEELSVVIADRERRQAEISRLQRERGWDRSHREGLIRGISFAIIGGLIWLVHVLGRRWLETEEEASGVLDRVYLALIVVIFGVITIVNLPQGVFEALRYALLEDFDEYSRYHPGGKLALSIASLPIWIAYLTGAIRAVRRGG